jgi:sugar lactone lactonase YvrE
MSSAPRLFCASRIAVSAFSLLFVLPAIDAQVTTVPNVVVDAQLSFALTASGSPISLSHPSGVAIAPDGTIYVADSANSRIVEISTSDAIDEDPITNPAKIGGTATLLIPPDGLSDPNAVAVGPDGTLYFSDAVRKVLYRVTHPESGSPVYTQLTYSPSQMPSALVVDPSGDLWVADAGLKEIIEFAPGATVASRKASVSPAEPTGIAVSASSLYFTDAATNAVYGQGKEAPLLSGFSGTRFDFAADHAASRPTGLSLDIAGNLYVLDAFNKRLVEFNPNQPSTAFLVPFSGLNSPSSMAIGSSGKLYITDDAQQDLVEFVYNGNAVNFGTVPAGNKSSTVTLNYFFNAAMSITRFYQRMLGDKTSNFVFDDNGCIAGKIKPGYTCQQQFHVDYHATTPGLHKGVVALSNDAADVLGAITSFGQSQAAIVAFYPGTISTLSQTSPNPTLLEPQAVVVSSTGSDLFVADEGGQQVGNTFTYSGAVYDYPQAGGTPTKVGGSSLVAPSALALDAAGDLYIADYDQGAVYVAPAANRSSATRLTIPGSVTLYHPIALTFDPSGNLYIGDTGPASLNASAASPGFVVEVPVGGGKATKFNYSIAGAPVIFPQALTTDTAGNLYIADAGDGQTNFGDLVVVPAKTGTPSYISTGQYALSEPAALGFDAALNLYVLDGYNGRILILPVTVAGNGTPTVGTAAVLPQTIPIATGSGMVVWPGGQEITITDIGENPNAPFTQVLTLQTKTANLSFGPIPLGSSQSATVTAINVGNTTAKFTPTFTETGDTAGFTAASPVCSGGIASQQQCNISFTYQPDQFGTTTAQFSFFVNNATSVSNYVNTSGTSTKASVTVTLVNVTTNLTYDAGTNANVIVSGNFGVATGTVQIYDGTTLLTTQPVTLQGNGEGYYYIPYGTLSAGTHTLTAVYSGNGEYSTATSAPVIVTVAPAPTSLTSYCYSSNGGTAGGNIVCGANISSATSAQPTGNVVFTVNGTPNTVPLVNQAAGYTLFNVPSGTYTIVVTYAAQGNYAASNASTNTVKIR